MANHRKMNLTPEQLSALYIGEHLSDMEIARRYGVCNITVANWRRAYGIRREVRFNYIDLPADDLKRMYVDEKQTMESIAKHFGCSESAVRSHVIRDGLAIDGSEVAQRRLAGNKLKYTYRFECGGYRQVKMESHPAANHDGYVREHRYLAESALGRYLNPGEQVHHINLEKLDNRIDNLAVLPSKAAHARVHKYMERVGVYLCGLTSLCPEPLVFGMKVFWGGRYVTQVDLTAGKVTLDRPEDLRELGTGGAKPVAIN